MVEWNWCDCSCDSAQHVAGRKCWETPIRMIWWMEVSIISFGWSWCGEAKKTKPPRGGWMYQRRALWLCQRTLHWGQQRTLGINANYIWLHPLWLHPFQICICTLCNVHCAVCIWLHTIYSKLWIVYSTPLLTPTWLQLFKQSPIFTQHYGLSHELWRATPIGLDCMYYQLLSYQPHNRIIKFT